MGSASDDVANIFKFYINDRGCRRFSKYERDMDAGGHLPWRDLVNDASDWCNDATPRDCIEAFRAMEPGLVELWARVDRNDKVIELISARVTVNFVAPHVLYKRVYLKMEKEHGEAPQCLIYKCSLPEVLQLMSGDLKPRPGDENIFLIPLHPLDKQTSEGSKPGARDEKPILVHLDKMGALETRDVWAMRCGILLTKNAIN
jgi:hypothetical protein